MITKYFIAKADEVDASGAKLLIMLNDKMELFDGEPNEIEAGNVAYEDADVQIVFAHLTAETAPDGWTFVPFSDLSPENCNDYKILRLIVEKLGYKPE